LVNKYRIEYNNYSKKDFEDVWKIGLDYLELSTISSVQQAMDWYQRDDEIYIFVRDIIKNEIVGEITLLPISGEQFQDFMLNKLQDTQLSYDNLLKYNENNQDYIQK